MSNPATVNRLVLVFKVSLRWNRFSPTMYEAEHGGRRQARLGGRRARDHHRLTERDDDEELAALREVAALDVVSVVAAWPRPGSVRADWHGAAEG